MDAMKKGDNLAEVEIDLGEPNDPGTFDNGEEAERLWKPAPVLEEEEDIHTSALVEISDTKPLIAVRDPCGINDCLKVLHRKCFFKICCSQMALTSRSQVAPLIPTGNGLFFCLQVTFEDVIAEPESVRSGDRVWIWSHALFEVSRVWIYRIVTALLAIPLSIISGIFFAILSCFHIW